MGNMERRRAALDRLSLPHSDALRLRAAGVADTTGAETGVALQSLGTPTRVAQAKLAAVQERLNR
ncbi:MAG TPA: hypothetical protein VIW24_22630 [Aldersonia sp.]